MSKGEWIIQLAKVAIGLYGIWWSIEVLGLLNAR
jgi:hypothetical protein